MKTTVTASHVQRGNSALDWSLGLEIPSGYDNVDELLRQFPGKPKFQDGDLARRLRSRTSLSHRVSIPHQKVLGCKVAGAFLRYGRIFKLSENIEWLA